MTKFARGLRGISHQNGAASSQSALSMGTLERGQRKKGNKALNAASRRGSGGGEKSSEWKG